MADLLICVHDFVQEILEIEQIMDEQMGLELNEANLDSVLDEIRPYLVGAPTSLSVACVYHKHRTESVGVASRKLVLNV